MIKYQRPLDDMKILEGLRPEDLLELGEYILDCNSLHPFSAGTLALPTSAFVSFTPFFRILISGFKIRKSKRPVSTFLTLNFYDRIDNFGSIGAKKPGPAPVFNPELPEAMSCASDFNNPLF